MTFDDHVKRLNLEGWLVLNLMQVANQHWRCNLQKKTPNGSTQSVYTEFADGHTAFEALRAAVQSSGQVRNSPPKRAKPVERRGLSQLDQGQRERLAAALDRLQTALDERKG